MERLDGSKYVFPRGCDSARVIQVIETQSARGSGAEDQPTRLVTEYWSLDGVKLAENDPLRTDGHEDNPPIKPLNDECFLKISEAFVDAIRNAPITVLHDTKT